MTAFERKRQTFITENHIQSQILIIMCITYHTLFIYIKKKDNEEKQEEEKDEEEAEENEEEGRRRRDQTTIINMTFYTLYVSL